MDIRDLTLIADYFVICTGTTERQVQAVADEITERLKEKGINSLNTEGEAASGWVLMDYSSVIVHIFTPAVRRYYDLEGLWSKARTIVRIA